MSRSPPTLPANSTDHRLDWSGGHPISQLFDDPFYSTSDGRGETDHVFLAGNGLPDRWTGTDDFAIAELGFGTGLNALQTWHRWAEKRRPGQMLTFISFEAFPLDAEALEKALSNWPALKDRAALLLALWRESGPGPLWELDGQTRLRVIVGDARRTVPSWNGAADAWFLDGFSPAKNPQMWEPDLMRAVAMHTKPGGTFATYTAAGWVRRNLQAAGFAVDKRPGFKEKKEMLCGRLQVLEADS
ncbi:MAG: tRNA (5-methylaminomethyl-2-thiouridine)(34)-methyltransferase MnmD [Brucellaceae bacterium]|nr:tRNA (5-methylaminomethyl-2-thiouridine)(34)-methyltransferase MnmD [Brucellaceae bacterium]